MAHDSFTDRGLLMKKIIGITAGDPAGIGPEIIIKSLTRFPEIYTSLNPVVFGHPRVLEKQAKNDGITVELEILKDTDNLPELHPGKIAVIPVNHTGSLPAPGKISAEAGKLAFKAIRMAIDQAQLGKIDAIATAPINKEALKAAAVPYLDHTEILTELTGSKNTMTLFITGKLRIFFYSRHIPFNKISASLDKGKIVETLGHCHRYLQQIGIGRPRLALAALNPHAGENGLFGSEEIKILNPAVTTARKLGLDISGAIPADSVFQLAIEGEFDAVLSLYHDQGHIAAKSYDFYRTISLTMGLPFLRTSVDHGTALNLAGQNKANATSMAEAIKAAAYYCF